MSCRYSPPDGLRDAEDDAITLNFEGVVPDITEWSFVRGNSLVNITAKKADVSESVGTAEIVALSPLNGATDVGYDISNAPVFRITFDRQIASADDQEFIADVDLSLDGGFAIYRASDDTLVYEPGPYAAGDFSLNEAKDRLKITPVNNHILLDSGTEYYITMKERFITFADGSTNPLIEKGDWVFTTKEYAPTLYGSDFKMGVDSLGFDNYTQWYGDNALYISDEDYAILQSKLSAWEKHCVGYQKWSDFITGFGGECYGASAVMALIYEGSIDPSKFQSDALTGFDLPWPKNSDKVASLIYYFHLLQSLPQLKEEDVGCTQREMGHELVTELISGTSPVFVNVKIPEGDHSVLAYSLDASTDPNNYIVYVADPNSLVKMNRNEACSPATMYISKNDFTITSFECEHLANPIRVSYGETSFLSVISDLSVFEKYNIDGTTTITSTL